MNRSSTSKHNIVLIGDSHIRRYAGMLKPLLNNDYDLFCVVKPGTGTSELFESAKSEIRHLTQDDLIIICSGTNDYDLNGFSLTFQNIKNSMMSTTHTNTLLMNVPFRYDLPNSFSVNKIISVMNRQLQNLVKTFPHAKFLETLNNRNLFTTHGLHRNKLGKKLVNFQLAHFLLTTFRQKELHPVPLEQRKSCKEENLSCDGNQMKPINRSSTCTKKTPITRSNDFLWLT